MTFFVVTFQQVYHGPLYLALSGVTLPLPVTTTNGAPFTS